WAGVVGVGRRPPVVTRAAAPSGAEPGSRYPAIMKLAPQGYVGPGSRASRSAGMTAESGMTAEAGLRRRDARQELVHRAAQRVGAAGEVVGRLAHFHGGVGGLAAGLGGSGPVGGDLVRRRAAVLA